VDANYAHTYSRDSRAAPTKKPCARNVRTLETDGLIDIAVDLDCRLADETGTPIADGN
jgi:hypothetical protein